MNNTIEITTKTELKPNLGYSDIFITWLPHESFNSILLKVKEVKSLGYNPIPHISVYKLKNRKELKFISHVLFKYTNTILLIRGSGEQEGKFNTVEDIIKTGIFNKFNIGFICGFFLKINKGN